MKIKYVIIIILPLLFISFLTRNCTSQSNAVSDKWSGLPNEKSFVGKYPNQLNWLRNLKLLLVKRSDSILPRPHSIILMGTLLGEQGSLPESLKRNLRRTGTIHIVVVSGYNITILASFVDLLVSLVIFNRRLLRFVLVELVVFLYVLMVGAGAPSVRAFIMSFILVLGKVFGRERNMLWILFLSCVVMLFINVCWINDIGFQLSFLATSGLILFANRIKLKIEKIFLKFTPVFKTFGVFIGDSLASTLAANALVWPVLSYYFGDLSLIAPLANVLVLWGIPAIMLAGTLSLGLLFIFPLAAVFPTWITFTLTEYFIFIVNLFGNLQFSSVSFKVSNLFLIFYYLIVGLVGFQKDGGIKNDS